jgi:membrane-associated protein
MELVQHLLDFVIHLDRHLVALVADYGAWTYAILFLIIFCETGLVVTPFLPGDSLLFAVGAVAATGALDPLSLCALLAVAAIAGDTANYAAGAWIGPVVFHREDSRLLNKKHLERTHRFYEKYGGKTIIIARFIPIIRTFAPFVAGIGRMTYPRFLIYNATGGVVWITAFVYAGYYFGNIPLVKQNFSLVILAIIVISILPGVFEYWRHRSEPEAAAGTQ